MSWKVPGWSWSDIRSQYLELEHFAGDLNQMPDHNLGGPIVTSLPIFRDILGEKFLAAAETLGWPRSNDFNAPGGREGAGVYRKSFNSPLRRY